MLPADAQAWRQALRLRNGERGALNHEQRQRVVAYLQSNPEYRIAALMQNFVVELGEERAPDEDKVVVFIRNYKWRRVQQAWFYRAFLSLVSVFVPILKKRDLWVANRAVQLMACCSRCLERCNAPQDPEKEGVRQFDVLYLMSAPWEIGCPVRPIVQG